jgi:hypothetical protein
MEETMLAVSNAFKGKVKLHDTPAYKLAQKAGIDPVVLSKLMNNIIQPKPNDPRILALAKIIGLDPGDCFLEDDSN